MTTLRIVSWNIENRETAWRELLRGGYDLALLQEAGQPPADVAAKIAVDPAPWSTGGNDAAPRPWRCAVVGLSDQVQVRHLVTTPIDVATHEQVPVSRTGTLALAEVRVRTSDRRLLVASMYASFEFPRTPARLDWIYADASAHRLISDLSAVVGSERGHRVIVGADLNLTRTDDLHRGAYWDQRHAGVFVRMAGLGIPLVDVSSAVAQRSTPRAERRFDAPVATYRTQPDEPSSAKKQVDFVFASEAMRDAVSACAQNEAANWGPSSHCRIELELDASKLR